MRPELACSVLRSRVVLLAEARIGAELKAAQERGEVARPDGSTHHRPKVPALRAPSAATLPDLGIPRQRATEMKRLAALGEEAKRGGDRGNQYTGAKSGPRTSANPGLKTLASRASARQR